MTATTDNPDRPPLGPTFIIVRISSRRSIVAQLKGDSVYHTMTKPLTHENARFVYLEIINVEMQNYSEMTQEALLED